MSSLQRRPNREGGTFYVYYYGADGRKVGKNLRTTNLLDAQKMQAEIDRELAEKDPSRRPPQKRERTPNFWTQDFRGDRADVRRFTGQAEYAAFLVQQFFDRPVVAVGNGKILENGERRPLELEVGDK